MTDTVYCQSCGNTRLAVMPHNCPAHGRPMTPAPYEGINHPTPAKATPMREDNVEAAFKAWHALACNEPVDLREAFTCGWNEALMAVIASNERNSLAHTARPDAGDDYVMPCDVHLPVAAVVKAGCTLATLKLAMEFEGRPRHFEGNPRDTLRPYAGDEDVERVARAIAKESGVSDWSHVPEHGEYDSRDYWRRLALAAMYVQTNPK